ncbi:uncharacterized protein LOC131620337 isoform X2 [Vicia villosa]|nr:uncharacterized protein LOC131620337 isoform X2 [Vicia villosa]XP_058747366.1 uncharacterized protein LOC131620337 isoform X2 [Vicia villosa]
MDVEEADNQVLSSLVSLNTMVCQQNQAFSLEDLAWVDSCLNKDSDISETDWSPLRDALLQISQSFRVDGRQDNESHLYSKEKNITSQHIQESSTSNANCLQKRPSTYNVELIRRANETSTDEILEDELAGTTMSSSTFQGDPFLPTYNEDLKPTYEMEHASENVFQVWDLDSATDEMEEASDNIFKVWDLDIPVEEGELVKQLKKALLENSLKTTVPSVFHDSEKGKDLKEGSLDVLIADKDLNEGPLDDLIAGIADLSLNKKV